MWFPGEAILVLQYFCAIYVHEVPHNKYVVRGPRNHVTSLRPAQVSSSFTRLRWEEKWLACQFGCLSVKAILGYNRYFNTFYSQCSIFCRFLVQLMLQTTKAVFCKLKNYLILIDVTPGRMSILIIVYLFRGNSIIQKMTQNMIIQLRLTYCHFSTFLQTLMFTLPCHVWIITLPVHCSCAKFQWKWKFAKLEQYWAAVAQLVEQATQWSEGRWFKPRLRLSTCRCVLGQDTSPQIAPFPICHKPARKE